MQRKYLAVAAVITAIAIGSLWRPAAAQGKGSDDVLPALLVEVKGLRTAIEQMASGSTQAQLLVGRLQLQEGRITSMIRRLDTVRDSLVTARREYSQIQGSLLMLQKDDLSAGVKAQVAAAKANVDRLAAEEMQLTADIAAEQALWVAINQRLDELERTLAKR